MDRFNQCAFIAGMAIAEFNDVPLLERNSDSALYLLRRRMRQSHAYLKNQFTSSKSLVISRVIGGAERSIIESLGVDQLIGSDKRIGVDRLLSLGRKMYQVSNSTRMSEQHLIAAGLYSLARKTGYESAHIFPEIRRKYVRDALLIPLSGTPSVGMMNDVLERFLGTLDTHLDVENEPDPVFNQWLTGRKNTIILQIQKARPTWDRPALDRDEINDAMNELTWRAVERVCAVCRTGTALLEASLADELNERELQAFRTIYASNPIIGGLRFATLSDRFHLLFPALIRLIQDPDDPITSGSILQLLAWYPQLAMERRSIDRKMKALGGAYEDASGFAEQIEATPSRSTTLNKPRANPAAGRLRSRSKGIATVSSPATPADARGPGAMSRRASQVADFSKIRDGLRLACRCHASTESWFTRFDGVDETDKSILIFTHECQTCNVERTTRISRTELEAKLAVNPPHTA